MLIHAEKETPMNTQQTELAELDRARAIHVAALNDGDATSPERSSVELRLDTFHARPRAALHQPSSTA